MYFRLGVVGHASSVEEIRQIVAESFDGVEVLGVEMGSDDQLSEAAQRMGELLPHLDGVLYTRREPYKLIVRRLDHGKVLARYADVDAASFVQSLLIACLKYQADIYRVSVDTLDYNTVMRSYASLEIDADQVRPVMVSVDTNEKHFVDATTRAHRESYRNGLCSICITNIRNVRDTLAAEGIPCVLMSPSPDNYINEIRRLIVCWQAEEKSKESAVAVRLRAELGSDYYLSRKTVVQNVLDMGKLAQHIVLFAQRVNGAFIRAGEQDFVIVCSYEELSEATEQFSNLDLLARIHSDTPYRLAVGIGTGPNLQVALSHAEMGTQRAWTEGCDRAYLVHREDRFIGPIQPNEILHHHEVSVDRQLTKAARDCSLSVDTLSRIDTFVRRKNSGSFITAELAQELRVSFRTAARIVEKLEKNGYAVEVGRSTINGRGRPTRILRLLW